MNVNYKTLNEFSFGALIATEESAIDFVLNCGLVSYNVINCNSCNSEMRLEKKSKDSLHYDYRCKNSDCLNFISATTNTWFFGTTLKWKTIL